jgi:hypothetical protein
MEQCALRYNPFAMPRRKSPEDLSTDELRRLLIEKRRGARQERLEHFRRTGCVVAVAPNLSSDSLDKLSPASVVDTPGENVEAEQVLPNRRRVTDRILLGVEVLAAIGLVGVLLSGLGMLRDLNTEVASALNPATATPTPSFTSRLYKARKAVASLCAWQRKTLRGRLVSGISLPPKWMMKLYN